MQYDLCFVKYALDSTVSGWALALSAPGNTVVIPHKVRALTGALSVKGLRFSSFTPSSHAGVLDFSAPGGTAALPRKALTETSRVWIPGMNLSIWLDTRLEPSSPCLL